MELFIDYFQDVDIRDLTGEQTISFRDMLLETRSPKTVNNILGVLRVFFKWLYDKQRIKQIPYVPPNMRFTSAERDDCSLEVFLKIVNEVENDIVKEALLTTRLQILRVGETRGLRWEDIIWDEDEHGVRPGPGVMKVRNSFSNNVFRETTKTGNPTRKHLHIDIKKMLMKRWGRGFHPKAFIFTYNGKPFYESLMRKQFNAARDKLGYPKSLTLYGATRHSGGKEGYLATKDIRALQKAMGHKDIRTTMRYEHSQNTRSIIEPEKSRSVLAPIFKKANKKNNKND